ncbi:MAG TPA: G5 domain-containing protein [Clostridia bacterium]|nr:G5 domain-containing protein [Clostridia bacterium]
MKTPRKSKRIWDRIKPELPGGSAWALVLLDVFIALCVVASGVWLLANALAPEPRISVTLRFDGTTLNCLVLPDNTVSALLAENGVALREGDELSVSPEDKLSEGMEIVVTRAFPVAVRSRNTVTVLEMTSGTVGDALREANVACDVNDELSARTFADVTAGMKIIHTDVETDYVSSYKTLNYKEISQYDDTEYKDSEPVLLQAGADGTKQVTQRIVVKDGVEVLREVVDQVVITPAIDEIIKYGTKIHYMTNYYGDERIYRPKPVAGKDGWVEMTMDYITAYSGDKSTATGRRPKFGTIAVNPHYIPYYTEIWVPGYGYGKALDTGAFRKYTNEDGSLVNQLDLFFVRENDARRWGRKRNVTVLVKLGD